MVLRSPQSSDEHLMIASNIPSESDVMGMCWARAFNTYYGSSTFPGAEDTELTKQSPQLSWNLCFEEDM